MSRGFGGAPVVLWRGGRRQDFIYRNNGVFVYGVVLLVYRNNLFYLDFLEADDLPEDVHDLLEDGELWLGGGKIKYLSNKKIIIRMKLFDKWEIRIKDIWFYT